MKFKFIKTRKKFVGEFTGVKFKHISNGDRVYTIINYNLETDSYEIKEVSGITFRSYEILEGFRNRYFTLV